MNTLEQYEAKHKYLIKEFEVLYEKYRFNDLLEHLKSIKGNFENCKIKFQETKKENCFNYINYFHMYAKIMNNEKDFVLFSMKDNPIESNIGKGLNPYIVSQNGFRWTKIISKSSEIINNSFDPNYYEDYCILDDIEKFIDDANKSNYLPFDKKPELFVVFNELPNKEVTQEIQKINVSLVSINDIEKDMKYTQKFQNLIEFASIINLDVNVIITICSELSNITNKEDVKISPEIISKCITGNVTTLDEIIDNKNFIIEKLKKYERRIICQSAYDKIAEFAKILIDKPNFGKEIARIKTVFDDYNIEIVPDQTTTRINSIKHSNKLANFVFGTGDYYKAVTITGYASFINNAKQNRVLIANIPCNSVEFSEKYLSQ